MSWPRIALSRPSLCGSEPLHDTQGRRLAGMPAFSFKVRIRQLVLPASVEAMPPGPACSCSPKRRSRHPTGEKAPALGYVSLSPVIHCQTRSPGHWLHPEQLCRGASCLALVDRRGRPKVRRPDVSCMVAALAGTITTVTFAVTCGSHLHRGMDAP